MNKIEHVAFLNPQGNFDQHDSYLAEHPDFNGQLIYVKELSKALAKMGIRVDIITRQINVPNWAEFSDLYDSYPSFDNLRIIRLPFGGNKFLAKEKLWPYLKEYVDGVAEFYDEEGSFPDFFSSHYGCGGLAGVLLKEKMQTPFSFTAHSFAAQKMDKLNFSKENFNELIQRFKFHSQLIAERLAIKFSNQIIVNTPQTIKKYYAHPYYQGTTDLEKNNKFSIIPPGVNTNLSNNKNMPDLIKKYLGNNLESNYTWEQTAKDYLKAIKKGLKLKIPVIHSKIPAYYFLPDSDNEHKLLEKFKEKVFKK